MVALVGNLLVVPGAFLIVLTGCLTLLTGTVSGLLAEIFNHANRVFAWLLLQVVDGMADVSAGHRYVRAPGWPAVRTNLVRNCQPGRSSPGPLGSGGQ